VTKRPHENLELIRRVLGKDYVELKVEKLVFEDEFETGTSVATLTMRDNHGGRYTIAGKGEGLVGGLWGAFLERFAVEYQSLQSLELAAFKVQAKFDTKKGRDGSDAVAEVLLDVRNSDDKLFAFSDASRSMASSTVRAVTAAIEYFVNAERAFLTLYNCRQDAKERQRDDLVTRYTQELAEVVKSTSYAEVIENIKRQIS
jgi:hypothetical protein